MTTTMADSTPRASIVIPPLSGALATLLQLSAKERANLRLLELIVSKDPSAIARLLALANSPLVSAAKRPLTTVGDALQFLGAERACTALFALWGTELIPCPDDCLSTKDALAHHIFVAYGATQRVLYYAGRLSDIEPLSLQLTTLVDRLSLALAWQLPQRVAVCTELRLLLSQGVLRLRNNTTLAPLMSRAVDIARVWHISPDVITALTEIQATHTAQPPFTSLIAEALLTVEAVSEVDRKLSPELLAEQLTQYPLVSTMLKRGVNPLTLL